MANFNRVILMGNLTRDPEFKQQSSGQGLCRLSIASNRQFRNKQTGTMAQEVCYIDISVWGPQADSCHQYLAKGRPILVEGRLKFDTWQDKDGQNKQRHSIVADNVVFLGSNRAEAGTGDDAGISLGARGAIPATKDDGVADALFKDEAPFTDDLPF